MCIIRRVIVRLTNVTSEFKQTLHPRLTLNIGVFEKSATGGGSVDDKEKKQYVMSVIEIDILKKIIAYPTAPKIH